MLRGSWQTFGVGSLIGAMILTCSPNCLSFKTSSSKSCVNGVWKWAISNAVNGAGYSQEDGGICRF